ncbi:MAG: hypothetical protein HPY81_07790 [Firmicutes bacterium]|nr:hypothetical protein [Bacillota bacterium]
MVPKDDRYNLIFKIVSILLAILMYVFVANERGTDLERIFDNMTVQVRGMGSDLVLVQKPGNVQVSLRGPVDTLSPQDIGVYVDLSGAKPGEHLLPVQVSVPNGVTVLNVKPGRVKVKVDNRDEKQVPVQVNLLGSPASGFIALDPVLKPSQIVVKGGASVLQNIQRVYVNIDLRGTDHNLSENLPVKLLDKQGNVITDPSLSVIPASVDVLIPVVKDLPAKTVPVKVDVQGTPAKGYQVGQVIAEPAMVKIMAQLASLKPIEYVLTEPIDLSQAKTSVAKEVPVRVPAGVNWVQPTTVQVVVQIGPGQGEMEIADVPVTLTNVPGELQAVASPASVNLRVAGPGEVMARLTPRDVRAYVDLSGLGKGTHTVEVKVQTPERTTVTGITPASVTITLN